MKQSVLSMCVCVLRQQLYVRMRARNVHVCIFNDCTRQFPRNRLHILSSSWTNDSTAGFIPAITNFCGGMQCMWLWVRRRNQKPMRVAIPSILLHNLRFIVIYLEEVGERGSYLFFYWLDISIQRKCDTSFVNQERVIAFLHEFLKRNNAQLLLIIKHTQNQPLRNTFSPSCLNYF
jgi:hypothetical protein